MVDTLKILGQSNPSATTLTDLYTVPSSTSTAVSSITVCNTSSTRATFRISLAIAGAVDDISQYIYYDVNLTGNDSFVATIGPTLATTDKIRVYASTANVVFQAFGVEVT